MTNEEAIAAIRSNWPPEKYTMLREALTMAVAALEEQDEIEEIPPMLDVGLRTRRALGEEAP